MSRLRPLGRSGARSHHGRAQAGLSLIELLIASSLLFFMVMGILPLFFRSAVNNAMGADSTQLSNLSKSRVEELSQMPFDAPDLTLEAGAEVRQTIEWWDPTNHVFTDTDPGDSALVRFRRTTEVRQYAISDLNDNGILEDELLGGSDPATIQVKEIQVLVESFSRGGESGSGPIPGRRILITALKTL